MQSWNKAESDDDECNIGCNSKMKHAQICSGATTILLLFIQKNISTFNKLAHQKCLKMKKNHDNALNQSMDKHGTSTEHHDNRVFVVNAYRLVQDWNTQLTYNVLYLLASLPCKHLLLLTVWHIHAIRKRRIHLMICRLQFNKNSKTHYINQTTLSKMHVSHVT